MRTHGYFDFSDLPEPGLLHSWSLVNLVRVVIIVLDFGRRRLLDSHEVVGFADLVSTAAGVAGGAVLSFAFGLAA